MWKRMWIISIANLRTQRLYEGLGPWPVVKQADVVMLLRSQQHVLEEVPVLLSFQTVHDIVHGYAVISTYAIRIQLQENTKCTEHKNFKRNNIEIRFDHFCLLLQDLISSKSSIRYRRTARQTSDHSPHRLSLYRGTHPAETTAADKTISNAH